MTRRELFRKAILTPLAAAIGVKIAPPFTWDKTRIDFFPTPEQDLFFSSELPVSLMGIPYHMNDGCTGSWLGFQRMQPETRTALGKLIETLENARPTEEA